MGGKTSKPKPEPPTDQPREETSPKPSKKEAKPGKSFSSFGRSSQRMLFQKSRTILMHQKKMLEKMEASNGEALGEIRTALDNVQQHLDGFSQTVKDKNRKKYEEVVQLLEDIREKLKAKTTGEKEERGQPDVKQGENHQEVPKKVELKLVKVISTENLVDVELREKEPREEEEEEEDDEEERQSGATTSRVKFGIQVMPVNPRVSQEMLKRKTLPVNETPKAEFMELRKSHDQNSNPSSPVQKSKNPLKENGEPHTAVPVQKQPLNEEDSNSMREIEKIVEVVDTLEEQLKYFHGKRGDPEYFDLHEMFLRSLIRLDNVEVHENPVVRQERKILIERIQELLKILEQLVQEPPENEPELSGCIDVRPLLKQQEVLSADGKTITTTAI